MSLRDQAAKELAVRIKDIDEAKAGTSDIIMFVGVLFRIGNNHVAVEITNPKRRIACRNIWINEWKSGRLENKIFVVRLHVAGVKIRHINKIVGVEHAHGHAFVNRAGGASVHRSERMCVVEIGIPTRDHSVFADENEPRGE